MNQKGDQDVRKVVVVGEGRVGKTSITTRFCQGGFDENQKQTKNASYMQKAVRIDETESVNLGIWDTAGQENYRSIAPMYYQKSEAVIIVYDITISETFEKARSWMTEIQNVLDLKQVAVAIVGNKSDKENERQVTKIEAEEYAKQVGATHFLASAKNNKGIKDIFMHIAQKVSEKKPERKKTGRIQIHATAPSPSNNGEKKKKRDCC